MSVCRACRESTSGSCWQHPRHYGIYGIIAPVAPANRGWECPRCNATYAPWVAECKRCSALAKEDTA